MNLLNYIHCVQITVDGDTSTNDTVLALTSGAAGNALITDANSPAAIKLEAALTATLQASPPHTD